MITVALGMFLIALTLLAIQLRQGRDPALGPAPAVSSPSKRGDGRNQGESRGRRDEGGHPHVTERAVSPAVARPMEPDRSGPGPLTRIAAGLVLLGLAIVAAVVLFGSPTPAPTVTAPVSAPAAPSQAPQGGEPEGGAGD